MLSANVIGEWTKKWAQKQELECEYSAETDSTNELAKNHYYRSPATILFVTESQTKGRGRGSNLWVNSKPGASLLSSWAFQLDQTPQPITAPLVGLAVYRSLKSAFGMEALSLKAPNDIYVDGKKAGGLLIEVVSEGRTHRLIVGLGLNIFACPDIANATEIASQTSEPILFDSWCLFLNMLYDELQRAIHDSTQTHLSEGSRNELLIALNQNPNLTEKFIAVEPNGTLRTKNETIPWQVL